MLEKKYDKLKKILKELKSVAVGFSGGVDSMFLLKTAADVLKDKCIAITVKAAVMPEWEIEEAAEYAKMLGVKHIVLDVDVFNVNNFAQNPTDRCYHCKKALFTEVINAAEKEGITNIVDGTNVDDTGDYRPGRQAALELGIISPLLDSGMTKKDIYKLSSDLGLPTAEKPSYACLASRIPYGQTITKEKLKIVEDAENILIGLGFKQLRVRHHGDIARIELPEKDLDAFLVYRKEVVAGLKLLGFKYVTLDMQGYRTGSLNEVIN